MTDRTPNQSPPGKKRDPDLVNAEIAIRRAAQKAREIARKTGVPIVILKDGRIEEVPLDDRLVDH